MRRGLLPAFCDEINLGKRVARPAPAAPAIRVLRLTLRCFMGSIQCPFRSQTLPNPCGLSRRGMETSPALFHLLLPCAGLRDRFPAQLGSNQKRLLRRTMINEKPEEK